MDGHLCLWPSEVNHGQALEFLEPVGFSPALALAGTFFAAHTLRLLIVGRCWWGGRSLDLEVKHVKESDMDRPPLNHLRRL